MPSQTGQRPARDTANPRVSTQDRGLRSKSFFIALFQRRVENARIPAVRVHRSHKFLVGLLQFLWVNVHHESPRPHELHGSRRQDRQRAVRRKYVLMPLLQRTVFVHQVRMRQEELQSENVAALFPIHGAEVLGERTDGVHHRVGGDCDDILGVVSAAMKQLYTSVEHHDEAVRDVVFQSHDFAHLPTQEYVQRGMCEAAPQSDLPKPVDGDFEAGLSVR